MRTINSLYNQINQEKKITYKLSFIYLYLVLTPSKAGNQTLSLHHCLSTSELQPREVGKCREDN